MKTSEKIAFYPGTFDPFTLGHASITRRALQIASDPRVEVIAYNDLTVVEAQRQNVTAILRGIRSIADFEYEKTIADLNRDISGIETLLLFTEPQYAHISSSVVRELLRYNQPVKQFIPKNLKLPDCE